MEPYPVIGDIWEWDKSGHPLLLLETDSTEKESIIFYCLDLVSGGSYYMSFSPHINDLWEKLG